MAAGATAALAGSDELLLADLIVAECVYVLESFYEGRPRARRRTDDRQSHHHHTPRALTRLERGEQRHSVRDTPAAESVEPGTGVVALAER